MIRSDFYFKIKSDKTKYGLLEMGAIFSSGRKRANRNSINALWDLCGALIPGASVVDISTFLGATRSWAFLTTQILRPRLARRVGQFHHRGFGIDPAGDYSIYGAK